MWFIDPCELELCKVTWRIGLEYKSFEKNQKFLMMFFLRTWQKNTCWKAAFLDTLQVAIIFQRAPHFKKIANSLRQDFVFIFRNMHFFVVQHIGFQMQSVLIALKVLTKSLKNVFEKFHFIANFILKSKEYNNQGMKVNRALKSYSLFFITKKAGRIWMSFFSNPNASVQRYVNLLFQN